MKLKRASYLALALGIVSAALGVLVPLSGYLDFKTETGSTWEVQNFVRDWTFLLSALGVALILSALFCLIFPKTVNAHCKASTSAVALGVSCATGAGLCSFLIWSSIVAFNQMSKHPIEYPASIVGGVVALLAFMGLISLYLCLRQKQMSAKGILIDAAAAIIWSFPFFCAFLCVYNLINRL